MGKVIASKAVNENTGMSIFDELKITHNLYQNYSRHYDILSLGNNLEEFVRYFYAYFYEDYMLSDNWVKGRAKQIADLFAYDYMQQFILKDEYQS
jgi:hypothetical protein